MEQRIHDKIDQYITELKEQFMQQTMHMEKTPDVLRLMQFICDYDRLALHKDDFQKRTRAKHAVYTLDQCCAKRSNGQRCTRRRKTPDDLFCGTHVKGIPYGAFTSHEQHEEEVDAINATKEGTHIFTRDIQGIVYYVDRFNQLYQAEDVLRGYTQPRVIGKCQSTDGGTTYQVCLS